MPVLSTMIPWSVTQRWIDTSSPSQTNAAVEDLGDIARLNVGGKQPALPNEKPLYLATAGAPLTGKSTLLAKELAGQEDQRYHQAVTIDPDEYTIPYMKHTRALLPDTATNEDAYHFMRPGSNMIANTLFNKAVEGRHHIAHGTTLTSPHTERNLMNLGEAGYEKRLLLCDAPQAAREDMKAYRESTGDHHATQKDFIDKDIGFAKNMGAYFTQGDDVRVFWKAERKADAVLAASYKDGVKTVHNPEALQSFVARYNEKRQQNPKEKLPSWDELERMNQLSHQAYPNDLSQEWQDYISSRRQVESVQAER